LAVADDAEMQIVIEHDPARIASDMAAALLAQVVRLLDEMAKADAATPLGKVDMLSTSETAVLLELGQPDIALCDAPPLCCQPV
jgi:hypothetical protein